MLRFLRAICLFNFIIINTINSWTVENRYVTFNNKFGQHKIRYKSDGEKGTPIIFMFVNVYVN